MSIEDRIKVDRGDHALLWEVLRLKQLVYAMRTELLKIGREHIPQTMRNLPDVLWGQCERVEGMVENMQTSCVDLPGPDTRNHWPSSWEVPVRTGRPEPFCMSVDDAPRFPRVSTIRFELEQSLLVPSDGKTTPVYQWAWHVREHILDTGIKVKR